MMSCLNMVCVWYEIIGVALCLEHCVCCSGGSVLEV